MSLELTIGSDVSGLISGVNAASERIQVLEQRIASLQRAAASSGNDLGKLSRATDLIKTSQAELNRLMSTGIPTFGRLANAGNELEKRIRIATSAEHEFNAILGATPALLAGAESPAQALGHEFLILATGIQRAREAGQSAGSIISTLGASIFSLQGAITLGTALLFGFGKEIFGTGKKAKETKDEIADLIKPIDDLKGAAAGSVSGEIEKVRALASAVEDSTKSYKERNNALTELKEINKSYFGDLTLEEQKVATLKGRVDEYTKALVAASVVKAFSEDIGTIGKELGKAQLALDNTTNSINLLKGAKDSKGAPIIHPEDAHSAEIVNLTLKGLTATQIQQTETVKRLKDQYSELNTALGIAIDEGLKFKPLKETTTKAPKVEDFGKELRIQGLFSKAFLDALKKDIEGIPDSDIQNLRDKFDDRLQEGLSKGIIEVNPKVELGDINNVPSANEEKQLNDLTKGFTQFGDRGVLALQKINNQFTDNAERIKAMEKGLAGLKNQFEISKELALDLGNAVGDAFGALVNKQDPVKAFFKSIEQSLEQLIAKLIAVKIASAALNFLFPGASFIGKAGNLLGLTGFGFAEGGHVAGGGRASGHVSGPGTSRSDSIPAMLSNGEFVMKAAAVQKYGVSFMNAINQGQVDKSNSFNSITKTFNNRSSSFSSIVNNISHVKHFADGGLVTNISSTTSAADLVPASRVRNSVISVGNNNVNISGKFRVDGKDLVLAISRQNLSDLRTT